MGSSYSIRNKIQTTNASIHNNSTQLANNSTFSIKKYKIFYSKHISSAFKCITTRKK